MVVVVIDILNVNFLSMTFELVLVCLLIDVSSYVVREEVPVT